MDLVVVSPAFEGMRFDDRMVAVLERWDGPGALEPLCFTPDEFTARSAGITVDREALRQGIDFLGAAA